MRQSKLQTRFRTFAIAAAAALLLAAPCRLQAASATALVSATVLGPAETEIASGAVTVSRVSNSDSERIEVAPAGRSETRREARALATFRVGGGHNASYAVALPERVTVKSGAAALNVSGFRTNSGTGQLASDGTATFAVGASVIVPSGQAPGVYSGSYPVTIAYN